MSCAKDDDEARVRPGDDGEDRGEGDRGDHREQDRAAGGAETSPPTRSASRGAAVLPAGFCAAMSLLADQRGGAEAERDRHQVEGADDADGPVDRLAGGLRRSARCRSGSGCAAGPRCRAPGRCRGEMKSSLPKPVASRRRTSGPAPGTRRPCRCSRRRAPSRSETLKSNFSSTRSVISSVPGDEQHGLDHLHPGGALHAADGDVEDHQRRRRTTMVSDLRRASLVMPSSSATSAPAPTIWASR